MWLLNRLKGNQKQSDFSAWLDKHVSKDLPNSVVAIVFNIYESVEQIK